eukprot:CAMPEP_0114628568 /NCGR_PEP_ID=MMETSP0168-20121206/12896_1 /TAXON_ID=95228 ORGANISM="Vannella sp., Strain DIVA3 517/6/12" /NCGR_SAMPLE_ID=MMETSP0168 /ASSEMBLY_ACC=CAM_ASM_000044 /LENGTH=116 /DNA_ID=CAMNT_0001839971 /DNA_START=199 /DNA_END=549 /DNA_ORIENTATION=-
MRREAGNSNRLNLLEAASAEGNVVEFVETELRSDDGTPVPHFTAADLRGLVADLRSIVATFPAGPKIALASSAADVLTFAASAIISNGREGQSSGKHQLVPYHFNAGRYVKAVDHA